MKLSEIKGEAAIDFVANVIDPMCELASDPNVRALFAREKVPEGTDAKDVFINSLKVTLPKILKDHKKAVIEILAATNGCDPAEYSESLTLSTLIADVVALVTDEDAISFLS